MVTETINVKKLIQQAQEAHTLHDNDETQQQARMKRWNALLKRIRAEVKKAGITEQDMWDAIKKVREENGKTKHSI